MNIKQNNNIISLALSLVLSIVLSLLFLIIFISFYENVFSPVKFDSMFSLWSNEFDIKLNSFIFAYSFFLPIFVMLFAVKKQGLQWLLLIAMPLILVLVGGSRHLLWFVIFTVAGGFVGWLMNMTINKFKTQKA